MGTTDGITASRRGRILAGVTRCALVTLMATAALTLALPGSASTDPPGTGTLEPSATPSTVVTENVETISSLRPQPVANETSAPVSETVANIVFPLATAGSYTQSFGEPRDGGQRSHKGIDIFADKLTPVVAAAEGTVALARNTIGGDCCVILLRHPDGSETLYLHLNNDTPGTDDGLGYGIAEDLGVGDHVEAGQVIGFVGDSGNAEETPPHLHFEYHDASGTAVDPYAMLRASQGLDLGARSSLGEIPGELAFTGTNTLVAASIAFGLVIGGVLLIAFTGCDDLWDPRSG